MAQHLDKSCKVGPFSNRPLFPLFFQWKSISQHVYYTVFSSLRFVNEKKTSIFFLDKKDTIFLFMLIIFLPLSSEKKTFLLLLYISTFILICRKKLCITHVKSSEYAESLKSSD